jgi:CBS domain-containing protein
MTQWHRLTAADVMSTPAETLHESTSVLEAARSLSDLHVSGVPVVGAHGAVVGVVSLYDIVGYLAQHEGPTHDGGVEFAEEDNEADESAERWERSIGRRDRDWLRDTAVSEVMTGDLVAVAPDAPLAEVAALMERRRIHRVVVAQNQRPLGVVSTLDILRAVTAVPARA